MSTLRKRIVILFPDTNWNSVINMQHTFYQSWYLNTEKNRYTLQAALSSGFRGISVFPKRQRPSGPGPHVLETCRNCRNSTDMQCFRVSCFLIMKTVLIIPFLVLT